MEIDVRVTVVPDTEKSTDGVVRTDVPLEQIRAQIVEALDLGNPDAWDIAIIPGDLQHTLDQYKPTDGDNLFLVNRKASQPPGFKQKPAAFRQTKS